MPAQEKIPSTDLLRRVIRVQKLTLVWMAVEAAVSLAAAWKARSPSLFAFGGDSVVELLSAAVVFWRFSSPSRGEIAEERMDNIAGGLLFVLAALVIAAAALAFTGQVEPRPSAAGIAILVLAAVVMPQLAAKKRRLSSLTASAALRADAAESAVCGYMSLIALGGLVVNRLWNVRWADPAAALLLLPLIVHEALEAMKGRPCCE